MNEPISSPKPHVAALLRAVEKGGGTQVEFAKRIREHLNRPSFKQQTVSYWITAETLLGAEWWSVIEHVTDGGVTAADLRPDLFGQTQHSDSSVSHADASPAVADHVR